jgi:RNA polymerase sigma-70 factor (ECF subfamily)
MDDPLDARPLTAPPAGPAGARTATQHDLYTRVADDYSGAMERLVRAYEQDPDRRRDLLQEVHLALWRSLAVFDGRCSLRTWVYRVAHNTATSRVIRRRAHAPTLVGLDQIDDGADVDEPGRESDRRMAMERLLTLIHTLKPLDRQIVLLYLEGFDAASIGEVTGLSPGSVATKVHRLKKVLTRRFHERGRRGE